MFTMRDRLLSLSHILALCALVTGAVTVHAQTSPTAAQDPVTIDQIWQQASSKYDGQRNSLLADVDRISHVGPFRPDFQSLQSY